MAVRSILRRKAGTLYRGYIEPRLTLAVRGRPRLDVSTLRTFAEYQECLEGIARNHAHWLRSDWFGASTDPNRLRGYCAACGVWTHRKMSRPTGTPRGKRSG